MQAPEHRLSSCSTQAPESVGSVVVVHRLSCPRGMWNLSSPNGVWDLSSPTRDQTHVPCIGRQILNHWTTREVPRKMALIFAWQRGKHSRLAPQESSSLIFKSIKGPWTSLEVQWLRLCASTAGGVGSITCWGAKIWHATWLSQKKKGIIGSRDDNLRATVVEAFLLTWEDFFFSIYLFIYLFVCLFGCARSQLRQAGSLVVACMWDLVLWPGIEPGPPALGAHLNHCTTREVLEIFIFYFVYFLVFLTINISYLFKNFFNLPLF